MKGVGVIPALNSVFRYTEHMNYVYILKSNDELYFGSTTDLARRMSEHNSGRSFATKGKIWKLVYYEAYLDELDAREREKHIKHHGQAKRWIKQRIRHSLKQS